MKIREATFDDLDELTTLFQETIQSVNTADYNAAQVAAWSASSHNTESWANRLRQQYFVVGEWDGKIVGFGSLTTGGYLDVLYVHKDYQRRGVAQKLYDTIERKACEQRNSKIVTDASITAKPFFERMGFEVAAPQRVKVNNIVFDNFNMHKPLS